MRVIASGKSILLVLLLSNAAVLLGGTSAGALTTQQLEIQRNQFQTQLGGAWVWKRFYVSHCKSGTGSLHHYKYLTEPGGTDVANYTLPEGQALGSVPVDFHEISISCPQETRPDFEAAGIDKSFTWRQYESPAFGRWASLVSCTGATYAEPWGTMTPRSPANCAGYDMRGGYYWYNHPSYSDIAWIEPIINVAMENSRRFNNKDEQSITSTSQINSMNQNTNLIKFNNPHTLSVNLDLSKFTRLQLANGVKACIYSASRTFGQYYSSTTRTYYPTESPYNRWYGRSDEPACTSPIRFSLPANPSIIPEVTVRSITMPGEEPEFSYKVNNEGAGSGTSAQTYSISYNPSPATSTGGCKRDGNLDWLLASSGTIDLQDCAKETITNSVAGELCATLTVTNATGPGTESRSATACTKIGKIPTVQISGGDLIVRGSLGDSSKNVHGYSYLGSGSSPSGQVMYGSWAEYGIFGPATVNLHSAGSLANNSLDSPPKNNLTFTNSGSAAPGGFAVSSAPTMLDFAKLGIDTINAGATYSGSATAPALMNHENKFTGNVTLTGGNASSGTYVIATSGDAHISGNITYTDNVMTNLSSLPQIIIMAKNITIDASVTNIDAWLIASDTINTCGTHINPVPYYNSLTTNSCDSKLSIQGVVQAKRILLRRTAGGEGGTVAERHRPAEVFNGRPDAYLWQYGRASSSGAVRTEAVHELPPRY